MTIRLEPVTAFHYHPRGSVFKYYVYRNRSAGRPDVYDVIIPTSSHPITIGRELDLGTVRDLIKDWEVKAKETGTIWYGDLKSLEKFAKFIQATRRTQSLYLSKP